MGAVPPGRGVAGSALIAACDADAWDDFHGARDLEARTSRAGSGVLDGADVFLRVASGIFLAQALAFVAVAAGLGRHWGVATCMACMACLPSALAWSGLRSPGRTRELTRLRALARERKAATTTTFRVGARGVEATFADGPVLSFGLRDTTSATIRPEASGRHVALRVEWGHGRYRCAEVPFVRRDDPAVAAFDAFATAVRDHDPAGEEAARLLARWSAPAEAAG